MSLGWSGGYWEGPDGYWNGLGGGGDVAGTDWGAAGGSLGWTGGALGRAGRHWAGSDSSLRPPQNQHPNPQFFTEILAGGAEVSGGGTGRGAVLG